MIRLVLAAAVAASFASISQAGFTMSHARTSIDSTHDRIVLNITNTGGTSGSNVVAFDLGGYGIPATAGGNSVTYWKNTASSGVAQPFVNYGSTTNSALRLTADPFAINLLAYQSPASWGSTANVALNNWGVVYLASSSNLNNNTNFEFASLVVAKDAGMHFDVKTAGSSGPAFGLVYDVPAVGGGSSLDITGTGSALAGTTGGNSYFIGINAPTSRSSSLSSNVTLSLVGDLQHALDAGAVITPSNGGLLVNFAHPAAGSIYNLTFRAIDNVTGASTVETLALRGVTGLAPEPASIASLLLGGALLRRRRSAK